MKVTYRELGAGSAKPKMLKIQKHEQLGPASGRILSDLVRPCQIVSELVRSCQNLSDLVRSCQNLSDLVRPCQILSELEQRH